MSRSEGTRGAARKAVALQYGPDDAAPVIVASGMGYLADRKSTRLNSSHI